MKWFAHEADAGENKNIRRIEAWGQKLHSEYGAIYATGLFFRLLEVISRHGEMFRLPDDYGMDLVANDLRTTEEALGGFLNFLAGINAIDQRWERKIIFCPTLAERVDRYTDEMIKATIAGPTEKTPRSYEVMCIVRVLSKHLDPRKRTHYTQPLELGCLSEGLNHSLQKNPYDCPGDANDSQLEIQGNLSAQTLHSSCTPSAPGMKGKGIGKIEAKASGCSASPTSPHPKITPAKVFYLWNDLGCKPAWENFLKAISIKAGTRLRISNFSAVPRGILRSPPPGPPPPQDQESRGTSP